MGEIVGNILTGAGLAAIVLVGLVIWANWPRRSREKYLAADAPATKYPVENQMGLGAYSEEKRPAIPDPGPYQRATAKRPDTTRR